MGILGSFSRYVRTRGRLLYGESFGWGSKEGSLKGRRKPKGSGRGKYLEMMEPRLLMTTVYGGEAFSYLDANHRGATATLTGTVAAELVAAVQDGSTGQLIFGDLSGIIGSGPRAGVVLGNGALPATLLTAGAIGQYRGQGTAQVNFGLNMVTGIRAGATYLNGIPTATPDQTHPQAIASDSSGNTYMFNINRVGAGNVQLQAPGTDNTFHDAFQFDIVQLNNETGAGTIVFDDLGTIIPLGAKIPEYTDVNRGPQVPGDLQKVPDAVRGAAFNPIDGLLYFTVAYSIQAQNAILYVDEMYSFNVATGIATDIGAIPVNHDNAGRSLQGVTALTFVRNQNAPTTATLYMAISPTATLDNVERPATATILSTTVASNGTFTPLLAGGTNISIVDGFGDGAGAGNGQQLLGTVTGLAALPAGVQGGGPNYLFALVNSGTASHISRIDLTNGGVTPWGNTGDLVEARGQNVQFLIDGNDPMGLTYNVNAIDPFSNERGTFMSVDAGTMDLIYLNKKLHMTFADIYSVYTNFADINAVISIQGSGLYGGNVGNLHSDIQVRVNNTATYQTNTTPANTGTAYIGFRGYLPNPYSPGDANIPVDGRPGRDAFIPNVPFLTGQLTQGIGIMPGRVIDTTDFTQPFTTTDKLFAGLLVGRSLETPLVTNSTAGFAQTLGGTFRNITGFAASPNGSIAVINSSIVRDASADQLAFVRLSTGRLQTQPVEIHLGNATGSALKNVEALGYGDPNLTGTSQLYAVYDLGDGRGPTLGTINQITGVFTPVVNGVGLGLGAHGKVTAIAFTPGGTPGNPTHQSVYLVADPNAWDGNASTSLYQVNATAGTVSAKPTYDLQGNVVTQGGIGFIVDASGNSLTATSALFDPQGRLIVEDKTNGRLVDVLVTTAVAGTKFATDPGTINPSVAGIVRDPTSLRFLVVDNLTGFQGITGTSSASSIVLALKDFSQNHDNVNLGKFLVDGPVTGKVTVSGAMDMFYAGWLITGDADGTGTWIVPQTFTTAVAGVDTGVDENYFRDNFHIGGDIRSVISLTSIGSNAGNLQTGFELNAGGKVGVVRAYGGTFSGVVHAQNQTFANGQPLGLYDSAPLLLGSGTDAYQFRYNGSATQVATTALPGIGSAFGFLSITDGANQAGSVFSNTQFTIDNFTASYTMHASGPIAGGGFDGGYAFVLQNQGIPAIGASGSGLGYSGILHSAALQFVYNPTTHSSSMILLVNGQTSASFTPSIPVADGSTVTVSMSYNGTTLLVNLNGGGASSTTAFTVDLATVIGSHAAYVGFTGSSGSGGTYTQVENFVYNGHGANQLVVAQEDLQHYGTDGDHTFAAGYLAANGTNVPFDNSNFNNAQYLGALRNSATGQPDVIHVSGVLEAAPPPTGETNQRADYFAFSALAGQTITVFVTPRTETNPLLLTALPEPVHFAIYDPDGRQIDTDYNSFIFDAGQTVDRAITFTADRPGNYRVAIALDQSFGGLNGANVTYDMKIQGLANTGIDAVVASGQLILHGSDWIANSTSNTAGAIFNPSIWANAGDVGSIVAGSAGGGGTAGAILAPVNLIGLANGTASLDQGYISTGTSSSDVYIPSGNLRTLRAGDIGDINPTSNFLENTPDLVVNGAIGLIQTNAGSTVLGAYTSTPSTGTIQVISAGGPLAGVFESKKSIGIIRAGSVPNGNTFGQPTPTEFHVDEDHVGSDGVIDLIDVTGNYNGASIIEGPSGQVRFMRVGGILTQDSVFEDVNGQTGTRGEIVYPIGVTVSLTDDSGATISLIPSTLTIAANGTNGASTTQGTLTVRKFGVRGHGGDVIVDVTSTTGITVKSVAGGSGRPAEIGTINVGGGATGITVVNAIPVLNATGGGANLDVILQSDNVNSRLDAFDIRGTTIDHITNTTSGDILNINAGDVLAITSHGSIGSMLNTTGAVLNGIAVFSNAFPFVNQRFGISVGNVGSIIADKSIGNVISSGVIGLISANNDNTHDPNDPNNQYLEGLTGPILISGTAAANQSSSIQQAIPQISISQIKIGEGISYKGGAAIPHSGIYAAGDINQVTGTNADIRGNIITNRFLGTITLTDGSLINSYIASLTAFTMSSPLSTVTAVSPQFTTDIDHPIYSISSIDIKGSAPGLGGGIIGTQFRADSIDSILVEPNGFGIFGSLITGAGLSTINKVVAGGYGIRGLILFATRLNQISATGSGADSPLSNYSSRVRTNQISQFNANTGRMASFVDDLSIWLLGDGITQRFIFAANPAQQSLQEPAVDREGFRTGVQELIFAQGQDRLGDVLAYDLIDSNFAFPDATGNINVRNNADNVEFLTGKVKSITISHNASNFNLVAAGAIGPVLVGNDFVPGTMNFVTSFSQIVAKGASGNIASFTNKGDFNAFVSAEGTLGITAIGTAGAKGFPGTGDFSGTLTVGGNHLTTTVFTSLKVWGAVIGGIIDISGNTGTIDVAKGVAGLSQPLTVRGNVANFTVGSGTASHLDSDVSISGDLASGIVNGVVTSHVIVLGNTSKFAINNPPGVTGADLLPGDLTVGGTLTSLSVGTAQVPGKVSGSVIAGFIGTVLLGELAGRLWGGKGITSATISGGIDSGASVTSSLGNIAKLAVTGGDINGAVTAPNGTLTAISLTGSVGATGVISARSIGALSIPGTVAGTINASLSFTSLTAGTVGSTAFITSPNLSTVTTKGDLNGVLVVGATAVSTKLTAGGNFGASATVASPLSVAVNGNMTVGSQIVSTNVLTGLAVKGDIAGDVFASRTIAALTAASISGSVITAGQGITSLKVTGLVSNSLIQVGLARGFDNIFGTGDVGEQARMADLGSAAVGTMSNSIVAVGGNIGSFTSTGNVTNSSISSGLVLDGSNIEDVLADITPLNNIGEMNAARQSPTLLHGNIKSISVGKVGTASTLINSSITAGVSPGADGTFGTPDDNVNTSITGGVSAINSFKGVLDGASHLLANSPGGSATLVGYTVGTASSSILAADPITGAPTATATQGSVATISTSTGIITITVTGVGATVQAYDNGATTDRLDTILVSSTTGTPVSVIVHTSSAGSFDLGRLITTDGTNLANFTFDGDMLGDINGGPSLWIDSDMASLNVRNMPGNSAWSGQIGGNIGNLTINRLGPGQLRIGGRVNTLTVNSSLGNPLLQQLGAVAQPATITQLFRDPTTGNVFASDGTNLEQVDINNGSVSSNVALHALLDNSGLTVNGLTFDSLGNLLGIATINNQNPLNLVGRISTTLPSPIGPQTTFGDSLHGMAINSQGVVYAVDSSSGVDKLVTINPVTGAETILGVIQDNQNHTSNGNILAIAFDANDNLMALIKDVDGSGPKSSALGVAFGRIITNGPNNSVVIANPGGLSFPVSLTGAVTNDFTGLAISSTGAIFAIRRVGSTDELDQLTVTGPGGGNAVARATVGVIKIDAGVTDTNLIGIGFDEAGNLLGMNRNGPDSELIKINRTTPANSIRLDAPALIEQGLAGFAVGKTGTHFKVFAYTTDSVNGGQLFTNPGTVATLGIVDASGGFTQLLPLVQDSAATSLTGSVVSAADDGLGHLFVVTDQGQLFEYSDSNGALVGAHSLGTVEDVSGVKLQINRLGFDASGRLIGLSATGNNLVQISTNTSVVDGIDVVFASNITEGGTVDDNDLKALMFDPSLNEFVSYSSVSQNFVAILGTSPDALGGLEANSFGTMNLPASFGGRVSASGNGALNGIDSVKITGTGVFTGSVQSDVGIGAVTGAGITFAGAIVSHADINSIILSGTASADAVVEADGMLKALTFTGLFDGNILAGRATTLTINGTVQADSLIEVINDAATVTINGNTAGDAIFGNTKTIKVGGVLGATASLIVNGDAGAVTLSGGTALGSLVAVDQGATSFTVGGTIAGVVAIRRNLTSAVLQSLNNGIFEVGGDLNSLTVNGTVNHSILATGTWIGGDGIYNTADDVIYGGSLVTAKVNGPFIDSLVIAGVLPREGVASGVNNIPNNFAVFKQSLTAVNVADVDGTEAGGIGKSSIGNITFARPVISNTPSAGLFSALITADGALKVTAKGDLQQIVRRDPPGAPELVTSVDPITSAPIPAAVRFSDGEIRITFNEPLDTATINALTITVYDVATQTQITDLTFGYFTQTAVDGSTQSVIQIISQSNFGGAGTLRTTIKGGVNAPTIADQTGLRSALLDYNQDGIADPTGDPFGTTLLQPTQILDIGVPANDNFNSAFVISGLPILVQGTNVNATIESIGEPFHGGNIGGASVWWTWTAPFTGGVTVTTDGSDFDTLLSVYSGVTVNGLVSLGSNDDDGAPGHTSSVSFNAIQGQVYKIAVDGFNSGTGPATGHIILGLTSTAGAANDNLAAAKVLTGATVTDSVSNFLASAEVGEPAHDGVPATASLWWKWTAPASGTVVFDSTGSTIPTDMSVYTNSTASGTVGFATLISQGENLGLNSTVVLTVTAGTTYYIAMDARDAGSTGTLTLNISPAVVPANDNFANAITILGFSVNGNNILATKEVGEPNHGGPGSHSVWYSWTAPATQSILIQTINSNFAAEIGVYTGNAVNALTPIATSAAGVVNFDAIAGETYMIAVDGFGVAQGDIVLEIFGA